MYRMLRNYSTIAVAESRGDDQASERRNARCTPHSSRGLMVSLARPRVHGLTHELAFTMGLPLPLQVLKKYTINPAAHALDAFVKGRAYTRDGVTVGNEDQHGEHSTNYAVRTMSNVRPLSTEEVKCSGQAGKAPMELPRLPIT